MDHAKEVFKRQKDILSIIQTNHLIVACWTGNLVTYALMLHYAATAAMPSINQQAELVNHAKKTIHGMLAQLLRMKAIMSTKSREFEKHVIRQMKEIPGGIGMCIEHFGLRAITSL